MYCINCIIIELLSKQKLILIILHYCFMYTCVVIMFEEISSVYQLCKTSRGHLTSIYCRQSWPSRHNLVRIEQHNYTISHVVSQTKGSLRITYYFVKNTTRLQLKLQYRFSLLFHQLNRVTQSYVSSRDHNQTQKFINYERQFETGNKLHLQSQYTFTTI